MAGAPTPSPAAAAATKPCQVSMRVTGLRSLDRRRFLSVALRTNRACRVTVAAPGFSSATANLTPATRTVVRIRRTKGAAKRITITAGTAKQTVRIR